MPIFRPLTRKREFASGSLGAMKRSIGYLQGGYKDSLIQTKVQLFNTVTQVGLIVYDSGYARSYRPGLSGDHFGYFSINDNVQYNKFSYITATGFTAPFTTVKHPATSIVDFGLFSRTWLLCHSAVSFQADTEEWNELNLSTDTMINNGNINSGPTSTTRQALSSAIGAFLIRVADANLYSFNFNTKAVQVSEANTLLNVDIQMPCGMSRNNSVGYIVGMASRNVRVNFTGDTVTAVSAAPSYTYQFGESHSVTSDVAGYMMAGYNDTTGKYGGTQHGLCQKIVFETESIVTMADLVIPQSSGQMMQGF